MFVPITSEVTISKGMVLKEIASERLFEVGERLTDHEVWGGDSWGLTEISPESPGQPSLALTYQDLARKYLAEVEE